MELNHQVLLGTRVLLVDDDVYVAEFLSDLLISCGCETVIFNDSQKALEDFKVSFDKYDLVISDVCMPNMTGDYLAEAMLKLSSNTPIILCSGYAPHVDKQKVLDMGVKDFIEKPIDCEKLVKQIIEIKENKKLKN